MGINYIYTFIEGDHTFRVYMHSHDYTYENYESIKEAILEFSRIESGGFELNFGEEFLAANKKFSKTYPSGEVHLTYRYQ
jgi:hypothetical protein